MKNVVAKWISKENFPKNYLGELSNNSSRRKTHNCFGELPSNSPRKVVQYILPKFCIMFSRTKTFYLKTMFSHIWLRHV